MAMPGNSIRINSFSYFSVQICLFGTTPCMVNQEAKAMKQCTKNIELRTLKEKKKIGGEKMLTYTTHTRLCVDTDISIFNEISLQAKQQAEKHHQNCKA